MVNITEIGSYSVCQSELQLQWTLSDFGRTAGRYGQASMREKISRLQALRVQETVAYDVATTYMQAWRRRRSGGSRWRAFAGPRWSWKMSVPVERPGWRCGTMSCWPSITSSTRSYWSNCSGGAVTACGRDALRLREATHKLAEMVATFSTVAGAGASDLEAHAAQGRLKEARPLVERLEAMAEELMRLVGGLALDALRE